MYTRLGPRRQQGADLAVRVVLASLERRHVSAGPRAGVGGSAFLRESTRLAIGVYCVCAYISTSLRHARYYRTIEYSLRCARLPCFVRCSGASSKAVVNSSTCIYSSGTVT
jgi:hypothetical protein